MPEGINQPGQQQATPDAMDISPMEQVFGLGEGNVQPAAAPVETPAATEAPVVTPDPAAVETPAVAPVTPAAPVVEKAAVPLDNPFFKSETPTTDEYNDFGNIAKYLQEKKDLFGVDVKEPKDLMKIFTTAEQLSTTQSQLQAQLSEASKSKATIDGMPDDLKSIYYSYLTDPSGDAYKKTMTDVLNSSKMDFTKDAGSYAINDLIKAYNPSLTDEILEEKEDSDKSLLHANAVARFNSDKSNYTGMLATQQNNLAQKNQAILSSIDVSIAELQKKFPGFNAAHIQEVRNDLEQGFNNSLFDAQDLYQKDAATKIAMARYGEASIENIKNHFQQEVVMQVNEAASKERELFAKHQNNKPTPTSNGSGQQQQQAKSVDDAASDYVNNIFGKSKL